MEAMWVKQQYDFIVVAKDGGHVSETAVWLDRGRQRWRPCELNSSMTWSWSPKMEAMWVKQQYDFIVVAKDGGHVSEITVRLYRGR